MKTNFWQKVILVNAASIAAIAATLVGVESGSAQSQITCDQDFRRVSCPATFGSLNKQDARQDERRNRWDERDARQDERRNRRDNQDARQGERRNRRDNQDARQDERRNRDNYEELNKIYRDVLDRDIDRRGFRVYSERIREGWPKIESSKRSG